VRKEKTRRVILPTGLEKKKLTRKENDTAHARIAYLYSLWVLCVKCQKVKVPKKEGSGKKRRDQRKKRWTVRACLKAAVRVSVRTFAKNGSKLALLLPETESKAVSQKMRRRVDFGGVGGRTKK